MINNIDLAKAVISNYSNGKRFMHEHVNHPKTITVNRAETLQVDQSYSYARPSSQQNI